MRCRLLNITALLSLLLCAAGITLWWTSRSRSIHIERYRQFYQFNLDVAGGIVTIETGEMYADLVLDDGWYFYRHDRSTDDSPTEEFAWRREVLHSAFGGWNKRVAKFPILLLSALLMIPPLLSARPMRSRKSAHPVCTTCSYNLTANTSGVCPECGKSIVGKVEARA